MTTDSDPVPSQAARFARENLGPASERGVSTASSQALILSRLRAGFDVPDAVLGEVHRLAVGNPRVADEFLAYFLGDLQRRGRGLVSPGLRRFLDTGDLVQSVLGDFWQEIGNTRFETRAQFVSLLAQRLRWKAADKRKSASALRRSEARRTEERPEDLDLAHERAGPAELAGSQEEAERLALVLLRLPERDQLLIRLYLRGELMSTIAQETHLEVETARKALQRAIRKARMLARPPVSGR